jgi:hypothetical protein
VIAYTVKARAQPEFDSPTIKAFSKLIKVPPESINYR